MLNFQQFNWFRVKYIVSRLKLVIQGYRIRHIKGLIDEGYGK